MNWVLYVKLLATGITSFAIPQANILPDHSAWVNTTIGFDKIDDCIKVGIEFVKDSTATGFECRRAKP